MAQLAVQGSEEDEQHRFMPRNWRAVLQAKEAVLQASAAVIQAKEAVLQASLRVEEDGDDAGFNAAVGAYEDAQFDAAVEAYEERNRRRNTAVEPEEDLEPGA
jgi:hypothetical protein